MQSTPPPVNEAQKFLTDTALKDARFLEGGDFRNTPRSMFLNFDSPIEERKRYEMQTNANQTGTFALGNNGALGQATALQGNYLKDKFARDSSQNFQNNIATAATNVRGALGQASSAELQRQGFQSEREMAILNALAGMYSNKKSGSNALSSILGTVGQVGGAALGAVAATGAI
jgi:hypothetical protein